MNKDKKTKTNAKKNVDNINIEETFKRLDKIISKLEDDKCSLKDSIKLYKEGLDCINITKNCLDNIKHELEIIDE